MTDFSIETEALAKTYHPRGSKPVRALDGLHLGVRQGEIFGLLGRNGAGKTTLLRILTTLVRPTAGSARVMGRDVVREPHAVRRNICAVLQENAVEIFLSVWDNLMTFARFHSLAGADAAQRAALVIEQFGLGEYRQQKVIDLSGGLKRRVQVAKVFMVDRPVVFLDEATTGMDPFNKRATLDAIVEQARRGRTIFLTTHLLEEAEELCDRIAIIDHGRLIASGDLPSIKSLAARVLDVRITFQPLTEEILNDLRALPLVKMRHRHNTVEATFRAEGMAALDMLSAVARRHAVVHVEVNSASLEDVFLELLGPDAPEGRQP